MPREPHRYNIVGQRASNLEVAETIAEIMGVEQPNIQMVNFHQSRPGHDMHYALDGTKLAHVGWTSPARRVARPIETVHWHQAFPQAREVEGSDATLPWRSRSAPSRKSSFTGLKK